MFLVANTSGKELVISDLGLSISPKQAFDLDVMKLNLSSPDNSRDLQVCIQRGLVKVLKSDRKKKRKEQQKASVGSTDQNMLKEIQRMLREEMRSQMAVQKKETEDMQMSQILVALKQLLARGALVSKEVVRDILIEQNESQEEPANIDEDTLNEIHARAIDRLARETGSGIEYQVKHVESDISGKVSELEGMIG